MYSDILNMLLYINNNFLLDSKTGAREILDSLSNGGSSLYEDPNIYEIEKLMSMKKIKGSNHYLVKWKHYGASDNTWEPEENIPQTVLTDFWLKKVKTSKQ